MNDADNAKLKPWLPGLPDTPDNLKNSIERTKEVVQNIINNSFIFSSVPPTNPSVGTRWYEINATTKQNLYPFFWIWLDNNWVSPILTSFVSMVNTAEAYFYISGQHTTIVHTIEGDILYVNEGRFLICILASNRVFDLGSLRTAFKFSISPPNLQVNKKETVEFKICTTAAINSAKPVYGSLTLHYSLIRNTNG